jgi:integrase
MSNRRSHTPAYRLHKQSGQAIVTLPDGQGGRHDCLLGPYDSPESRAEYDRLIAEWLAAGRRLAPRQAPADGISVNELILAYWPTVEAYYRRPDGTATSEVENIRLALRPLKALYGHTPAADFDSLALEAVRGEMIRAGRCRSRINRDVARIKRLFKWGGAKKHVPAAVWHGLLTVENLHAGRSEAKERPPVQPVAEEVVNATLPFLRPQPAAMVLLQLYTGMRPGEVIVMRTMDLEMAGPVWTYRPGSERGPAGQHKTAHRGHQRVIHLGPRAQEVLKPWLRLKLEEYLFQPRESRAAYDAERRQRRRSKVTPSQARRRPKAKPKRTPGERYSVATYDQAIGNAVVAANKARLCDACKKRGEKVPLCPACEANQRSHAAKKVRVCDACKKRREEVPLCEACQAKQLPHWHPHQLRHTKATEIRRTAGLDAARAVLGHRSTAITEVYAEVDATKAAEVMARIG